MRATNMTSQQREGGGGGGGVVGVSQSWLDEIIIRQSPPTPHSRLDVVHDGGLADVLHKDHVEHDGLAGSLGAGLALDEGPAPDPGAMHTVGRAALVQPGMKFVRRGLKRGTVGRKQGGGARGGVGGGNRPPPPPTAAVGLD